MVKQLHQVIDEVSNRLGIQKEITGLNQVKSKKMPGVSVILCTCHLGPIDLVFENFLRQNYGRKELIIILNNDNMDIDKYKKRAKVYKNIKVFQLDENITLGACFEFGVQLANFEYIAKFDDDDYYGRNYLTQVISTFEQKDYDVVGKAAFFVYFIKSKTLALCGVKKENKYVTHLADATLVFKRNVFDQIEIPTLKGAGTFVELQRRLQENGFKLYSTDRFNFVVIRNPNPEEQHTWKVVENEFLSYSTVQIIKENLNNFISYIELD